MQNLVYWNKQVGGVESGLMSKSEKLRQNHQKRITDPIGIVDNREGLREY